LNDKSGSQGLLKAIKTLFPSFIKDEIIDEVNILLQQLGQLEGLLAKILDKAPIKPYMAKKRTNLSHK